MALSIPVVWTDGLRLPTVLVQEGGHVLEAIGELVRAGTERSRARSNASDKSSPGPAVAER